MSIEFWITTAAIFVGPVVAVLAARWLENKRRTYERKHAVFRSLMKTRRTWANAEHVEALNLVEIEFHGRTRVLSAYKNLFDYFVNDIPRREDEDDQSYFGRKAERHSGLLSALLLEMSRSLGYRHDQFEILRGGYSPVAHGQIERDQESIRRFLANVADNKAVFPVAVLDVRYPEAQLEQAREAQLILSAAQIEESKKDD